MVELRPGYLKVCGAEVALSTRRFPSRETTKQLLVA